MWQVTGVCACKCFSYRSWCADFSVGFIMKNTDGPNYTVKMLCSYDHNTLFCTEQQGAAVYHMSLLRCPCNLLMWGRFLFQFRVILQFCSYSILCFNQYLAEICCHWCLPENTNCQTSGFLYWSLLVVTAGKHTWRFYLIWVSLSLSQTVWYQEPAAVQWTPVPALHDGHCCHDIRGVPHRAGPSAALQSRQPIRS